MNWSSIAAAVGLAVGCALASRVLLHYDQLESYQFRGYFRSLRRNRRRAVLPGAILCAGALLLWLCLRGTSWGGFAAGPVLIALGWAVQKLTRPKQEKKKFAVTARVKRLFAALILVLLAACLLTPEDWRWPIPLLLPLWVALAKAVAWPVERGIYELYFQSARRILKARSDLIKIGITGSFGKTSVKFILNTLLSEEYQVLATPASFNTPMGLTRVIRERLRPAHRIFLAEMGARHRGDIRELCRLVHPDHGVLTSVGAQHLDTFGTLERIIETKYDLIRAIPAEGIRFFPDDGDICRRLYDRTDGEKRLASLTRTQGADVWAENIAVSARGSSFDLCTADGGRAACETKLLGAHNIQNILLAASVCLALGMTLRQVSRGIARLEPVEHRLQLIERPGGITLIDDAFNSNPAGASRALDVLKAFPPRRIIVTPGMVELGAREAEYNRRFGEQMASSADIAILVGPRHTAPIREGLLAAGFPEKEIRTVQSLTEAAEVMRALAVPGDTVLFENDLPDNYSET
ncbi:MAG: UDP-N-acetylmuramoyl-tripeptide--D-alanyl-D-alanine ligase [Clostridia bacterium]|nr:UDP-N-acetylmuramoyl-tripeptide--D-alanyl-D-alanine ligase [Clostridia bacterium]